MASALVVLRHFHGVRMSPVVAPVVVSITVSLRRSDGGHAYAGRPSEPVASLSFNNTAPTHMASGNLLNDHCILKKEIHLYF